MSEERSLNFIEEIIEQDLKSGKYETLVTRFPPEPNGYLHIGHAKAICLNFGLTQKYGGYTNLRFDDTNPVTEKTEYVNSQQEDIKWLGYEWKNELYASDYFETLYNYAVKLIEENYAYVDDSSAEEIATLKGTPTVPGTAGPSRSRSKEENLDLFKRMRAGEFEDGSYILRAKIDLSSSNMLMRDPIIYRIKHAEHHRTGNNWCIYPMYDFAHGQSDSIENITHSICTLEYVAHRELYDWFIEKLGIFPSRQYEFARLNLTYTVMSKRKLMQLVNEKVVSGWNDPRMPTISGLRRRGYTANSIREFCERIGIAKRENLIELSLLEFCIREELNKTADRVMGVLDPLKLTITNYDSNAEEILFAENNPEKEDKGGVREVPFSNELWIEREDFMDEPSKKWFRLAPGAMVRLKNAYIVQCDEFVKNENGEVVELKCTYIPESKSGSDTSGLHVKGTIHWVSARHAKTAEVRVYDRLFSVESPDSEEGDFKDYLNPESLKIISKAYIEPSLVNAKEGVGYQFMRKGYYCLDSDSTKDALIFNQTVTLKEGWSKK